MTSETWVIWDGMVFCYGRMDDAKVEEYRRLSEEKKWEGKIETWEIRRDDSG